MDPEKFKAIVSLLQGMNSSGTLNTGDLSILQNAILGVLTQTYTPPVIGKTTDQLLMDNAPSLLQAQSSGDPILQSMASSVLSGVGLFDAKIQLRKMLAGQNPAGLIDGVLEADYMTELSNYKSEWDNFQKAERTNAQLKIDNDPFVKHGLPAFEEQYDPEQMYSAVFQKLKKDYDTQRGLGPLGKPIAPVVSNTSEGVLRASPDNPKYNPQNYTDTPIIQGNVVDAIRGDKQTKSSADFLSFIKSIDKSTKMVLEDPSYAQTYYRDPNLNPKTLAGDLKNTLKRGLVSDEARYGNNYKTSYRPFSTEEQNAIKQYIAQLEQDVPVRTNTIVASAKTPSGLRLNQNASTLSKLESAEKAKIASGAGLGQEEAVRAAMSQLLAAKMFGENRTPLVDTLTERGLFAAAASIPKKSGPTKNWTVKGSNVVKLGK